MENTQSKDFTFNILESRYIDTQTSKASSGQVSLVIEHSTTRSAYVSLWKGVLNGVSKSVTFNFEFDGDESTEAFIEVRCPEKISPPKVYPIDFSKKNMAFDILPKTSWETTEVSLYFTQVRTKGRSLNFHITDLQTRSIPTLNHSCLVFEDISISPNDYFTVKDLGVTNLSKGVYSFKNTTLNLDNTDKLGILFTSVSNKHHVINIDLIEKEAPQFELLGSESFTVSLYALLKKKATVHIDRLTLYTQKSCELQKTQTRVCAIIPSFNCGPYIERSVNSLLNQTQNPQAIYIVDDRSSDNTRTIVENLVDVAAEKDVLLDYIRLETNCGPYIAKNMVIHQQLNNFDFFALQDADDYSESTRLETQLKSFNNKNTLVSYTFMQRRQNGTLVKNRGLDSRRSYATGMFKKQYFEELGYFEAAKFGADDEMFNRANQRKSNSHAVTLKDVLYIAEFRKDSLTNGKEQVSVDTEDNFLSEIRKIYADSFTKRYRSQTDITQSLANPFYRNKLTPEKLRALPKITFNVASYPPRFSSLVRVLDNILRFVESVDGLINVCLNTVSSLPPELKEFESNEAINFIFPKKDLKDNGKFINIREGINFWMDDDILYTESYIIYMIQKLLTTPKNTALCVHGSNKGSAYSSDREVRHFLSYYPNRITSEIAGTGTLSMLVDNSFILSKLKHIANKETTGVVDLLFALECSKLGIDIYNVEKDFHLEAIPQPQNSANLFTENKSRKELIDKYMLTVRELKSL